MYKWKNVLLAEAYENCPHISIYISLSRDNTLKWCDCK